MQVINYEDVAAFLERVQPLLEAAETVNSLMLGLCLRLRQFPERVKIRPYLATVEDDAGPAMIAAMTPPHNLILVGNRDDFSQPASALVQDLLAGQWSVPGVLAPSTISPSFAMAWEQISGQRHQIGMRQRLYHLHQVTPPAPVRGQLRPAVMADINVLADWIYAFQQEIWGSADAVDALELARRKIQDGEVYFWSDGHKIVAMAGKSRPTARTISINLVYTPPHFRRNSYASAVTAGLSQMLLDQGFEACVLFTDLANQTSNHIYQSIGYQPVCDFTEYRFRL